MRGRKPKPTALKILAGNPGKRRLPINEPKPRGGIPDCPAVLDKAGRTEWDRITAELAAIGLITHFDLASLAAYCSCWARFLKLEKAVQKEGEVVDGRRNPYLLALNRTLAELRAFGSDFGLNPVARSRMGTPAADLERDEFASFLKASVN